MFFISILEDIIIYDIARRNPIEVMGDIYFTIIAKTKIILTLLPRNITKYFYCHWILFSAFLLFFRSVIIFYSLLHKCFQSFLFKDKCSVRRKRYVSHTFLEFTGRGHFLLGKLSSQKYCQSDICIPGLQTTLQDWSSDDINPISQATLP